MAPFTRSLTAPFVCVVPMAACLMLAGCDEKTDAGIAKIPLGDKNFFLEIVADDALRFKGLSGRQTIAEDGGMIFVFPNSKVQVQSFVMRDCAIPIDIIYLDSAGRILAMHNMQPEPPRGADEVADADGFNEKYDARLKRYSSRFPAQFVIEIQGGMIQKLNLKEGDRVKHDWDGLKRLAR